MFKVYNLRRVVFEEKKYSIKVLRHYKIEMQFEKQYLNISMFWTGKTLSALNLAVLVATLPSPLVKQLEVSSVPASNVELTFAFRFGSFHRKHTASFLKYSFYKTQNTTYHNQSIYSDYSTQFLGYSSDTPLNQKNICSA